MALTTSPGSDGAASDRMQASRNPWNGADTRSVHAQETDGQSGTRASDSGTIQSKSTKRLRNSSRAETPRQTSIETAPEYAREQYNNCGFSNSYLYDYHITPLTITFRQALRSRELCGYR